MSDELYPLTLEPAVAEQPWSLAKEEEFSDGILPKGFYGTLLMGGDTSKVAAGPLAGRHLGYVRQAWGAELVGTNLENDFDSPLAIELKLKRTADSALAVSLDADSLWFMLASEDGGSLNAGFQPGLNLLETAERAGHDLGMWAEFMPEYCVEDGQCLLLPQAMPLLLGAGLTVAQISRPTRMLPDWPVDPGDAQAVAKAEKSPPPTWMEPLEIEPGRWELYHGPGLSVQLIVASQLSDMVKSVATTFIWPIQGQGRIRTKGPAPVTRIQPGKVIMMPAGLGRYAVASGGTVKYLLIEAF